MEKLKNLYIKSYGCQMNIYDSQKMAEMLQPFGYKNIDHIKGADMIILNTCHIREKASEKIYSELGRIRDYKKENILGKNTVIVVAGCVGQAEGEEIFNREPIVDIVVGPQSYHNLPLLLTEYSKGAKKLIDLDFSPEPKFDAISNNISNDNFSSFLSIQEGCNEFCRFCVVPYTRGAEFSRSVSDIYKEALKLASGGAIEITLLGQNVNAYNGYDIDGSKSSLGKLIKYISNIPQISRIRYTTSHPRSMFDDLIDAHKTQEKLMPFLHLPVQSGSNKVLKSMNRKHNISEYLSTIDKLKQSRPDMGFSSDFIVGYPGESDDDFRDTIKLIKEVQYAQCYSFKYSQRPGTPAAIMNDQIEEHIKSERLIELQSVINHYQKKFNNQFIGKTVPVLFERKGKKENQLIGKTPHMQSIYIDNAGDYIGQIIDIEIREAYSNSLYGIVQNQNAA
ncbi:MAG: tRNA (N6-isopentenyl adenosine(37)-C2)-methylthiotransferase MiaB [Rickettsiales bacterium]|nr:MAG: tRNA (N6-isopentenyl adenosine(37)-C2)-methylthiotransferase MiaB [Rickettsiales bacterium]